MVRLSKVQPCYTGVQSNILRGVFCRCVDLTFFAVHWPPPTQISCGNVGNISLLWLPIQSMYLCACVTHSPCIFYNMPAIAIGKGVYIVVVVSHVYLPVLRENLMKNTVDTLTITHMKFNQRKLRWAFFQCFLPQCLFQIRLNNNF